MSGSCKLCTCWLSAQVSDMGVKSVIVFFYLCGVLTFKHFIFHNFWPRDAMHSAACHRDSCSVCPCIVSKWVNISSNLIPCGSPAILVFPYQTLWQYFNEHPHEDIECRFGMKNHDFWPVSRCISEMILLYGHSNQEFEGMPLFNLNYLRQNAR